ncbi:glycosyl transferase [Lentzea pudingi]|uniref:Glycosyl transferase n=1 Tax=Lentzea pudingi TaxID=1789439 RepID=A0ABQ2ITG7_9PSEU|nr:glycosyltransferase family 39 protein [Lentzea pudingi]GGN29043.1 glycosyl transferase [Lentzea pudingi]
MTALLDKTVAHQEPAPPRENRLAGWARVRRTSLLVLGPLLLITGLVRWIGLSRAPQRIDDEGTYVAQAFAVERFGELSHYTYWYDHPPLGWLQIAGYTTLTNAFERTANAVVAGREFMVIMALVSALLLWLLARRLGVSRLGAGIAVAVMALSPLAVQFQRTVYLDNVATPWMLGAFVLALSPQRRLAATAGAAVCFGVAVLSKETYLLMLPLLLWLMIRNADRSTRRYALAVAGTLFVLIGLSYVLLAVVKGELVPGMNRVSLADGLYFQLFGRESSGSVLDAASLSRRTFGIWFQLDVFLPIASVLAAVAALWSRRLRPVAVGYLVLLAFMLRPGYLPVPYVIALIPLAALLIGGVADLAVRKVRSGRRSRFVTVPVVLAAVAGLAVATPAWGGQLRGLTVADLDAPVAQAQAWVIDNVPVEDRVVVDDALWVDLVRAGRNRDDVVWYYKVDTDPAVAAKAPGGWRDYDWIVSTNSLRTFPDGFPIVDEAMKNSTVVATFGTGTDRVDIARVDPSGADAQKARLAEDTAARTVAGQALAGNPRLSLSTQARQLLVDGRVDGRLLGTLATAAATGPVTVVDFPGVAAEEATGQPRRQALLAGADGLAPFYEGQIPLYRPSRVETRSDGLLVAYPPVTPAGVLRGLR